MMEINECADWVETHEEELEKEWKCSRCGECCLIWGFDIPIEFDDVKRWKDGDELVCSNLGIYPILDFVDIDIWINPKTGDDVDRCPFLRKIRGKKKYECLINGIKPEICKNYDCYSVMHKKIRHIIKQRLHLRFKSRRKERNFFRMLNTELENRAKRRWESTKGYTMTEIENQFLKPKTKEEIEEENQNIQWMLGKFP